MTAHPARFTPDQRPGVGAAIAALAARARRLRTEGDASPLPSVQNSLARDADAIDAAITELKGLM